MAVSSSSSIRFQVSYSAFSFSHALRLAESGMGARIEIDDKTLDTSVIVRIFLLYFSILVG